MIKLFHRSPCSHATITRDFSERSARNIDQIFNVPRHLRERDPVKRGLCQNNPISTCHVLKTCTDMLKDYVDKKLIYTVYFRATVVFDEIFISYSKAKEAYCRSFTIGGGGPQYNTIQMHFIHRIHNILVFLQ